jgi:O-antigen ligase
VLFEPIQDYLLNYLPSAIRNVDEIYLIGMFTLALSFKFIKKEINLKFETVDWMLLTFLIINLLSGLSNELGSKCIFLGIFADYDYILLFYLIRMYSFNDRQKLLLLRVVIGIGVLFSCIAVIQSLSHGLLISFANQNKLFASSLFRATGLFIHPNDLGHFLVILLFTVLSIKITGGKLKKIIPFILVILLIGILFSVSRSSYIAIVFSLAIFSIFFERKYVKHVLFIGIFGFLAQGIFLQAVTARIDKISDEGGDARWTYVKQSIPIIKDYPILGVGPGHFGGSIAADLGSDIYNRYGFHFWIQRTVDGFWLKTIVETGVAGFVTFMSVFIAMIVRARKNKIPIAADKIRLNAAIAIPLIVIAEIIYNYSSPALEANNIQSMFWLMMGILFISQKPKTTEVESE